MTATRALVVLIGIILFLLLVFLLQNLSVVPVKFLFWSFEMRRAWLVFSLFGSGVLSGMIIAWLLLLPRK